MGIASSIAGLFGGAPNVSLLRLYGPIGTGGFGRSLDLARLDQQIEKAFKAPRLAAVALAINSPGGAPVQSAMIAGRIRELADKNDVPVLAFCEDVAASGGYWLACAADEIFVDPNTIIGSIGVVSAGFGFHQAIERLGVERRVHTAGDNKWRLDPFLPSNPDDQEWLTGLQSKIHRSFIDYVKTRRGSRLPDPAPERLFSGEAFLGADAMELGLADGYGRLRPVLEERFGEKVRVLSTTPKRSLISRILGGAQAPMSAEALAAAASRGLLDEAERRAMMARFGL